MTPSAHAYQPKERAIVSKSYANYAALFALALGIICLTLDSVTRYNSPCCVFKYLIENERRSPDTYSLTFTVWSSELNTLLMRYEVN